MMPQLESLSHVQSSKSISLSNLIDITSQNGTKSDFSPLNGNTRLRAKSTWTNLAKRALNIDKCVSLLRDPNLGVNEETLMPMAKRLCQLRHHFKESPQSLYVFLNDHLGLDLLFDILRKSDTIVQPSFVWAYLQLEVINCLKVVMESPAGIEKIISPNSEYADKLATALNTNNCTVKKQIFELLSALCVYNKDGHWKALHALQHYQASKRLRYKYQVLVEELRSAKNVEYKTTVMAFINCLIISADSVKERNDIRNELIGLKLLDIIASMRRESDGGDLSIQCDVFDEQRISDENLPPDVNSHQDIFYTILRQISGNAQFETPFLHLLQHLLRIEYSGDNNELSAIIWDSAETLVHRATTLIECKEDAEKLLRLHQKRRGSWDALGNGPSTSSSASSVATVVGTVLTPSPRNHSNIVTDVPPPPPPPPPIPTSMSIPPPPPPPPPPPFPSFLSSHNPSPSPPMQINGLSSSTTPLNCLTVPSSQSQKDSDRSLSPVPNGNVSPLMSRRLPQQEIPKPKARMKSLNWCKIPSQKVIASGRPNIWSLVATQHETDNSMEVDFTELEGLFCQPTTTGSAPNSCPGSPRLPRRQLTNESAPSPYNSLERKVIKRLSGEYQTPQELSLLDSKKSLNVNIFLKQYRGSTDEIVSMIRDGKHKEIGAERLRNLIKILPEANEVEMLNNHQEDHRLPIAEKFLLSLIRVPNYKLRIEGMLLKEEFEANVAYLEPAIDAITNAAKELKSNKSLHEILYLILVAGNFLNSGGYAGDAAGFKMMSLLKLPEIRANKPGVNLIHYVAMQAEKKGLLNFAQGLPSLDDASKVSIESLRAEVNSLANKITKIKTQNNNVDIGNKQDNGNNHFHNEMKEFLTLSEKEVKRLSAAIESQLEKIRVEMAEFLCEDLDQFKVEECFRIFSSFCQRFKLAIDENERRRENEMKLEARKSNSHLMKKNWTSINGSASEMTESTASEGGNMINMITSTSGGTPTTPNGTLDQRLKRRSRRCSQDDELHAGLIEFLKTANDLGTNDVNIFGTSFRRVGSGRKSRTSNPMTDIDFNSRERNPSDSVKKDNNNNEDTDGRPKGRNRPNSKEYSSGSQRNSVTIDGESDGECDDDRNKNFNRFSPLRKTFSLKPSELEARLSKRLEQIEDHNVKSLLPNGDANNNTEELKMEPQNNNKIIGEESRDVRKLWNNKEINNNIPSHQRPTSLSLKSMGPQTQPTAVISPTKVEKHANTAQLSATIDPIVSEMNENRCTSGRFPRRTTLSAASPSTATAAAIVAPLQLATAVSPSSSDSSGSASRQLKSKLPVRKNSLTKLPQQRKPSPEPNHRIASEVIIPRYGVNEPSINTTHVKQIQRPNAVNRRISEIPPPKNYRTAMGRAKVLTDGHSHHTVNTPIPISTTRRPSQVTPANRSFMKQTSASAAKTRSMLKY